jgi:hypothetical protein
MPKLDKKRPPAMTGESVHQLVRATEERMQGILNWLPEVEEQLVVTVQDLEAANKLNDELISLNKQHCVHITDLRLDVERKDRRIAELQAHASDLAARIRQINLATSIEPPPVEVQASEPARITNGKH